MKPSIHVPVLATEIIEWLTPKTLRADDSADPVILVDGTLGGGGHTRLLAALVGEHGRVLAVDRDPEAVARAEVTLQGLPVLIAQSSYTDVPELLQETGIEQVDGILVDLGLSSDQLEDDQRGFSFNMDGPLDLRFDPTEGKSAAQLIKRISPEHLADIIYQYGEERFSRRIARAICERQRTKPIESASDLADIVRRSVPPAARHQKIDAATRTFQALRIAVNEELKQLDLALRRLPDCLRVGGRFAAMSFHSLEDRLVKNAFRDDKRLESLTRKPVVASESEIAANPRSRSAKLRIAERV